MVRWLISKLRRFFNTRFGRWLTPRLIKHASFLIPGKRLRESPDWLAIQHPQPVYPVHLLVLSKRNYNNWLAIPATDSALLSELVDITQSLISEYEMDTSGYRLIINGGKYQEFPHLHIHLVSGDPF